MSVEELDPEVVADLQLRAYTQHDRSRSRADNHSTWRPEATVGYWNCRREGCMGIIAITQDAVDRLDDANRMLQRRGELKIKSREVAWCDGCVKLFAKARADRLRERTDAMATCIRELKEHPNPRSAHDLIAQISKLRHPDLQGLLEAIEIKRKTGPERAKRERRGGM